MTTATKTRARRSSARMDEIREEALTRATCGKAWTNFPAIIAGFVEKGIPADQILPRENVFTYRAWQALGRQVRKGEKGVRVCTWVPVTKKDEKTGEKKPDGKRPWTATVFHVSQTDPIAE